MYHRVVKPDKAGGYVEPGMFVTPETFALHCALIARYFRPVSLGEILRPETGDSDQPRCAITFDDGWIDFNTHAFPILSKFAIPSTVFLPTDFIGTEKRFWTDRLVDILSSLSARKKSYDTLPVNSLAAKIVSLNGSLISRIDRAISLLKSYPHSEVVSTLRILEERGCGSPSEDGRSFLNWNEVRALRSTGLVTFGSHTVSHSILSCESEEMCIQELKNSRKRLIAEKAIDAGTVPFCYPNGGFTTSVARQVKKTGYSCAVTTQRGWNDHRSDRFILKRVGMHQDMSSSISMALRRIASGAGK